MTNATPIVWNGDREAPASLRPFIEDGMAAVARRYPVAVSEYWLSHCTDAPGDPFRLQAFPDCRELDAAAAGDSEDPFGELAGASPLPGMVRRFSDRVLVVVADVCAMRCRHCTRKNLLGRHAVPDSESYARIVEYVASRPEIREVLLSGGDPLMLGDHELGRRIAPFAAMAHVYSIRIATRIPCTDPGRVTQKLAGILGESKKIWVNTQFNHPAELTPEAVRACATLVDAGIPVSCQTVLLKEINDNASTLEELFRRLQAARVRPYYAFAGDPVVGTAHFRVTPREAAALEREVARRIGGLALPRFVADIPGAGRKVPVWSDGKPE